MNFFSVARLPRIEFGRGSFRKIPGLIKQFGSRVLLVTGGGFFQSTAYWDGLICGLKANNISWAHCTVAEEPSPQLADAYADEFRHDGIDVVVGIGGGSALDLAKAVAGLLRIENSVMDFLEGVGPELPYAGPAVPFIAVPTTAGTGSEATKNAVLSVHGAAGFKKSFRDDKLVAEYALIDAELLRSCPPQLIAANGMDALTQLIESYVSSKASEFTDALAASGLRAVRDGLLPWYELAANANDSSTGKIADESVDEFGEKMAYAALISGITLAQVGLGSVHGLASPLGAFYPIPHGVVCGTLVAEATKINISAMLQRQQDNPALVKYARLAEILAERPVGDPGEARQFLLELLVDWTKRMKLPLLGGYGVQEQGLEHVVANSRGSSMKTNPVELTDDEIKKILLQRL